MAERRARAGSCTGYSHEQVVDLNPSAARDRRGTACWQPAEMPRLCRADVDQQFLLSARRFASGGAGAVGGRHSGLRGWALRPQFLRRGGAGLCGAQERDDEPEPPRAAFAIWSARGWCFADGTPDIVAYPTDREAYGRLCKLLSIGNLRGTVREAKRAVKLRHFAPLALRRTWPPRILQRASFHPPGRRDALDANSETALARTGRRWRRAASGSAANCRFRRQRPGTAQSARRSCPAAAVPAASPSTTCSITTRSRRVLQDVVTCIREHMTIFEAGRRLEQQCRTPHQAARGDGAAVPRAPGGHGRDAATLPRASTSRSMSCATTIPRKPSATAKPRRKRWSG